MFENRVYFCRLAKSALRLVYNRAGRDHHFTGRNSAHHFTGQNSAWWRHFSLLFKMRLSQVTSFFFVLENEAVFVQCLEFPICRSRWPHLAVPGYAQGLWSSLILLKQLTLKSRVWYNNKFLIINLQDFFHKVMKISFHFKLQKWF